MKKNFYLSLLALLVCGYAQAQLISTFAGNGTSGYSGNGGPATAAEIQGVYCLAADGSGNLYLADYGANVVRKINASGIISTFAGTGSATTSGDGGPASAAALSGPIGVAVDGSGNVYISEYSGDVIRKVNTSGIISTYVSGGLSHPTGLCFDASNNLYIANQSMSVVSKVNTSGFMSTFAGNGSHGFSGDGGPALSASLAGVTGVAADASGNLYISCWDEQHVRKVDISGIISTVAGTGTAGFSGDGGPATAATVSQPYGIAVDAAGNLFIADVANSRIRKVTTSTGIITTFAGTGISGYNGDGIPATAANIGSSEMTVYNGALFFNDGPRIRRVTLGSAPVFTGGHSQVLSVCESTGATPINTLLAVSDLDAGQTETWTVTAGAAHGTLLAAYTTTSTGGTLTPTGLTYTPASGFSGADSFTVSVSDGSYTDTTMVHVTINPLPVAGAISGPSTLCAGDSITLTESATGGVWGRTNTRARVSPVGGVRGLRAGVDTIKYTVTNGCGTAVATRAVTINPLPNAGRITGPAAVCVGATITQTDSTTGGTWFLTNSLATLTTTTYTAVLTAGMTPGRDTIFYTVSNGCGSDTIGRIISIRNLPPPISGPNHLCQGDTASFSDSDTSGTWRSSNNAVAFVIPTTSIVLGATAGTATISYGAPGCAATATITINALPAVHALTGGNYFCQGDTGVHVMLNGSNAGVGYQLLNTTVPVGTAVPGTGGPIDFGLQTVPGAYTAVAINPVTGCMRNMTGSDTVNMGQVFNPTLTISATPGLNIAAGQSATLHAVVTNGGAAPTYQWMVNSTYIGGANAVTYTSSTFQDKDSVTCFVTSNDPCGGNTSSHYVIIHVHGTGVQSVSGNEAFNVFPNPNKGTFAVNLSSQVEENATVTVTNLLGEKVKEFNITSNKVQNVQLGAAPGVYFVTAVNGGNRYSVKVLVE